MAADQQTLGEYLRQEREKRGITIEQVASATKIGVKQLHSLEGDHYADLPAKPFVRGFVTSYCRFIGLDPKETLTRFNSFIDRMALDRPSRESGHSGYAFEKREGEQSRTVLMVVLGVFVVVGVVVFILFGRRGLHHHHATHVDKLRAAHEEENQSVPTEPSPSPLPVVAPEVTPVVTPQSVATQQPEPVRSVVPEVKPPTPVETPTEAPEVEEKPEAVVTPIPSASPSSEAAASGTVDPKDPLNSGKNLKASAIKIKVIVRALADVWVRYRTDQRPVMKFVMRKDKILVLRAIDEVRFQSSNPESIEFSANGAAYKTMLQAKDVVKQSDVITLVFPRQLAEKIQDPFPGESALPPTAPPSPETPDADASPTP